MVSPDDPTRDATRDGVLCPSCSQALPPGGVCPNCGETVAGEPGAARAEFSGPKQIADYRIVRELGAGGMGTVFEAEDTKMNRRVALKVLSRHFAPSEKAGLRFEQEAWIAGRLNHPNLVKVYERGTWEELSYYSMELVGGGSLADVVSNMKRLGRDDRLGLEFGSSEYVQWAIKMVVATARGLDYAHRQGVVHRDVKPVNVMISRESGSVKIADFGLAFEADATRMTTDGRVMGTLCYMAPEQILGKRDRIDRRTDIYALGVTLFELLTLEMPYRGETQQLYVNAVLTMEARRPSKINERVGRDLEVVIRKALEKDSAHRYESAGAFADDLENVLRFRPIRARPPSSAERLWKWVQRRPMHATLIGVLIVGLPLVAFLGSRAVQLRAVARQQRIEALEQDQRWLNQRREYRKLIEPTTKILDLDPKDVVALKARAFAYMSLSTASEDAAEASTLRDQALADVERIIALEPAKSWPLHLKSLVLTELGMPAEAEEARMIADRNRSAEPDADDLHFEAHVEYDHGNYDRAIELFSGLLTQRPGDFDALAYRGYSHEALDRLDQAIQDYRLAVALNPDDFIINLRLGGAYTQAGSLDEGERHTQRALELAPESATVYEGLSSNYVQQGLEASHDGDGQAARDRFEQAEAAARKSLELRSDLPWAHLNLGASLMEQNRLLEAPDAALTDEAIDHYERALALMREEPVKAGEGAYAGALVNMCDAQLQAGRPGDALPVCTEVTELWPKEAVPFYNLAGAYALLGRDDEALAALERDFELGDRDWEYLAGDRWFESLRGDERFEGLLERMRQVDDETE
jgi:tetratricopeptide (TPR) repeat protein